MTVQACLRWALSNGDNDDSFQRKKGLLEWTSGNGYHINFLFRLIGMHFKAIYLCQNTSMLTEMHVHFRNEINSFISVSLLGAWLSRVKL